MLAKARWGSQLDLLEAQEVEVMEVEPEEDEAPPSDALFFEEEVFILLAEASGG